MTSAPTTPATPVVAPTTSTAPAAPTWNSPSAFASSIRSKFPTGVAQDGTPYAKMSDDELTQRVVAKYPVYAKQIQGYSAPQATQPSTIGGRISSDIKQAGSAIENDVTDTTKNPVQAGIDAGGAAAGAIANTAADVLPKPVGDVAKDVMNAPGAVANWLGEKIGDTKAAQDFVTKHPEAAGDLAKIADAGANLGSVAGIILGAKGGAEAVERVPAMASTAASIAKAGVKGVYDATDAGLSKVLPDTTKSISDPKVLDQKIVDSYTKAIKPTIAGKTKTVGQMASYNKNVASAVKTIVANKDSLDLRDEFGDPAGHTLPKTIEQFGHAINNAKTTIFNKYDALTKEAGEKGADVQLHPVADELDKIANDTVTKDLHPDLASYAKARADTMRARGAYSMPDAGKAVQNLNKTLESFYRNPSYETASKASVDALIANKLRTGLDDAVSATTDTGSKEPGYQALKNQYGSLRAIENDVVKRGVVHARQTGGRSLNFGDVASAEEVIRGLAHLDPKSIAIGAGIKGVQALRRHMTDPNRAVANMFDMVDKSTSTGDSSRATTNSQK